MMANDPRRVLTDRPAGARWLFAAGCAAALAAALLTVGCTQPPAPEDKPRPVKLYRVGADAAKDREARFSGEVRARYESRLGFRVGGKIVSRHVDVGDRVRAGQVIATLDPSDYRLAARALASQLAAAVAERDLAQDDVARYRELLNKRFISEADFDRRVTAHTSAGRRVEALQSQLANAENQVAYSRLVADHDGVVTRLEAEVGQVVSPGQPIATVARLEEREVVIAVPEQRRDEVREAAAIQVSFWPEDERRYRARVREIAPSADPVSRTYQVRLTLLEGREVAGLGRTATAYVRTAGSDRRTSVPLAAVFSPQSKPQETRVWVLDEPGRTVRSVAVTIGTILPGEAVEISGVEPGLFVVAAGVQRLAENQSVRVLGGVDAQLAAIESGARGQVASADQDGKP